MPKANTSPLSGMRDFLPVEVLKRNYVVDVIEKVYQNYGFEPLETPVMERLETLLGKYGEEGDQLIYRIMKRGEKLLRTLEDQPDETGLSDSGLRYDLTVPLSRVVAEYQSELPRIFKRYQIQPVFRADRPARGRFREFFQCDLDIVGSDSRVVEAEVLNAAAEVLIGLRFGPEDFRIRLNHRTLLRSLIHACGVPVQLEETTLIAVDKLDKIGAEGVMKELRSREISEESARRLLDLLDRAPSDNESMLEWMRESLAEESSAIRAVGEMEKLLEFVEGGPAAPCLQLDPALARGLSYYTGPIFELEFDGFPGSAGGGGRYDELIGMFAGRKIPACGFSLGLERILLILEERKLFPERLAGRPDLLVTQFSDEMVAETMFLAQKLRATDLRVDLYPETGKYGKQFKYADQRGIRFALLYSPREKEHGVVTVKDLATGFQQEVAVEAVPEWIRQQRSGSPDA